MISASSWAQKKPTPPPVGNPAIAFLSRSAWAHIDLMVMDADGANKITILNGTKAPGYGYYAPQWSPSGEWIVVARTDGECTSQSEGIFLVKKDGTGLCKVGPMVNTPGGLHGYPQWSPDGLRLIYSDSEPPVEWGASFYMLDAVCSAPTRIHVGHLIHGYFADLTLSPDGSKLAAHVVDEPVPPATEPTYRLFVYSMVRDEEGGWLEAVPLVELTSQGPLAGAEICGIDWANDPYVDKLAVGARYQTQAARDIYVINLNDPYNPVNITNTPDKGEMSPSWSPLDDQIVYVREGNIYKMNADGSSQQLLATHAKNRALGGPAWRRNQ
ncbi:MAG: DPP IV N-terminal domain-containing protein [Candidatus Aminicenantes bacterium]|nr:DPP IV N-terminal domain-containing protein [Candidatus Aminicenantes bacterium]